MNSRAAYDRLAPWYDADMGASMPFDDIEWYARLCRMYPGPALELGCGTGRVLLALATRGVDITGLDQSCPMLQILERNRQRVAPMVARPFLICGDAAALPLRSTFAVVLAPYAVVTYLTDMEPLTQLFESCRRVLRAGGVLALDTFIPRATHAWRNFRIDYSRPCQGGRLQRAKRIEPMPNGCNRITRRYQVVDEQGYLTDSFETTEIIRPWSIEALIRYSRESGFVQHAIHFDYDHRTRPAFRQFATLIMAPA